MIKSNKIDDYLKIDKNFDIKPLKFYKKEKKIFYQEKNDIKNDKNFDTIFVKPFRKEYKLRNQRTPFFYNLGIYFITPLLLGVFLGYQFDRWFKTKPIFILLFILLGTIASFYNLLRLIKE